MSEATLALEGDFVPVVAVAASNESDGVTSFVRIDGPATEPVVSFTSSPPLPEEEVLSHLLFGRGIQNLSALQAAQLANAVATLAGKGGVGIVGRLRQGFGLDDLDVQTGAEGGATLRAGKRLALANSPIIRQAAADIEARRGQALQAGLYPNPNLGFEGDTMNQAATAGILTWGASLKAARPSRVM